MKKLVLGFALGCLLSLSTAGYAAEAIHTMLLATFKVNGVVKDARSLGYEVVQYHGRAYIPLRFVADQLGIAVAYEEETNTILLDDRFDAVELDSAGEGRLLRAGEFQFSKAADGYRITGKLFVNEAIWDHAAGASKSAKTIRGKLVFWNDQGKVIERISFEQQVRPLRSQIVPIQAVALSDVSNCAAITLEEISLDKALLGMQPSENALAWTLSDPDQQVRIAIHQQAQQGRYTAMSGWLQSMKAGAYDLQATITFYDRKGKELGSAVIDAPIYGPGSGKASARPVYFIGKGDVTAYHTYTVRVERLAARVYVDR